MLFSKKYCIIIIKFISYFTLTVYYEIKEFWENPGVDYMDKKKCVSFILGLCAQNKNVIFLVMCLGVHFLYMFVFFIMKIYPFAFINLFSSAFYVAFLIFSKDKRSSEMSTVAAYFEILIFALLSETISRNTYGFIFFVLGMIPVIFFLAPSYGNKRFVFQGAGIVTAILIDQMQHLIPESYFKQTYTELSMHVQHFRFINLLITLFTILYVTIFYKLEVDMMRSELDYQCTHDPLTGLYNRRFLYDEIKKSVDNNISVVLIDIDNFKKINDRFGHDEGDDILVRVSGCLKEEANGADVYAVRWGGEEFIIFYSHCDEDTAYERISELCRKITRTAVLPDNTGVTVTVGLASGTRADFDELVKKADSYLYQGKKNGKNCIVWNKNEEIYSACCLKKATV